MCVWRDTRSTSNNADPAYFTYERELICVLIRFASAVSCHVSHTHIPLIDTTEDTITTLVSFVLSRWLQYYSVMFVEIVSSELHGPASRP